MIDTAALIIIGTELTRGIIQDRHGQFVSKALSSLGIHMTQIVAIPDDGTIESILGALVRKNDLVVITGGLGPTSDDMTRECIADVAASPLEHNEESWKALYAKIGDRISGANGKQTLIPRGFTRMPNPNGTADGFYGYTPDGRLLISLPGPPKEMQPMFENLVVPLLSSLSGKGETVRNEYSSFITAEAKLEDLTHAIAPDLTWGTRFQDYKISLYLSGGSEEDRERAIAALREECGSQLILDGDVSALDPLVSRLRAGGLTIACAESCTGGLAGAVITSAAGSSDYFLGSVVSYSNSMKETVLGVDPAVIAACGAVSEECAEQMAEGARRLSGSDVAFSVTGVAGPAESERKKVGHVCFGFSSRQRGTQSVTLDFSSWGRESVRRKSVVTAFLLTAAYLDGADLRQTVSSWKWV